MNLALPSLHGGSHKVTPTVSSRTKEIKNVNKEKKNSYIKEVCTRIVSNKVLKKVLTSFSELSECK